MHMAWKPVNDEEHVNEPVRDLNEAQRRQHVRKWMSVALLTCGMASIVTSGVLLSTKSRRMASEGVINRIAGCAAWASSVASSSENQIGKKHCEAKVLDGADVYDIMDDVLRQDSVMNQSVDVLPLWSVDHAGIKTEYDPKPNRVKVTFGMSSWWWPSNLSQTASLDRVVFVHGCDSSCDVQKPYYSTLTSRLALYMQMPVLATNFATEPEHPWPQNVRSVLKVLEYAKRNGPFGPEPARNIFIVADSEGSMVALNTLAFMVDISLGNFLGVPSELRPVGAPHGQLPLSGMVLISPTVDAMCTGTSLETNCWDTATGKGDITGFGFYCGDTVEARRTDCRWSWLLYYFGMEAGAFIYDSQDAKRVIAAVPQEFWQNPAANPLKFDFSMTGVPPILIITGAEDFYASDGIALARHACETGADVHHFLAKGMWHDFVMYSEGCGGSVPIPEAVEAYQQIGKFAKATRVA